jgi:hypothetical protein
MFADPDFEIESLRKSAAIVAKHELLMPHELSEVCRHASKPPEPSANTDVAGAGQVPVQMWQGWAQSRRRCGECCLRDLHAEHVVEVAEAKEFCEHAFA